MSNFLPFRRRSAADLPLYPVELPDALQGLVRDGRAMRLVEIVELTSNVRPSRCLYNAACFIELVEPGVSIALQDAEGSRVRALQEGPSR